MDNELREGAGKGGCVRMGGGGMEAIEFLSFYSLIHFQL